MRLATPALALALALAACDAAAPVDPPPAEGPPTQAAPVERTLGLPSGVAEAHAATLGRSFGARASLAPPADGPEAGEFDHWNTALWLAGRQSGVDRFLARANGLHTPIHPCLPDAEGPGYRSFHLVGGADYDLGEWPVELGAPLRPDGRPLVYGDAMDWDAYCAGPRDGFLYDFPGRYLEGLRVNAAVFFHDRADLAGVRFYRYEITNTGDAPVDDLRAGFYSDADVSTEYYANLLGGTDRYAYVYTAPGAAVAPDGAVSAMALLETPRGAPLAARRIEYRNAGPEGAPPLTERALNSSVDVPFFALRGLDDNGDPLVDPTTGEATPFIYGGDPVAGTGWLDGSFSGGDAGWDLRVLQATAPVALAPGETVVLTAATVSVLGDDLADGLADVDALVEAVRAEPELWRYPVASD